VLVWPSSIGNKDLRVGTSGKRMHLQLTVQTSFRKFLSQAGYSFSGRRHPGLISILTPEDVDLNSPLYGSDQRRPQGFDSFLCHKR